MKYKFSRKLVLFLGVIIGFLFSLSISASFWINFQQWLFTGDFLKVFLGTMMGGIIAGFFSLKIAKNQNAFLMHKLKYENKIEICKLFLREINPSRCIDYSFNLQNIISMIGDISIICGYQYSIYAKNIASMLNKDIYCKYKKSYRSLTVDSEQQREMFSDVEAYIKFFNVMQLVTSDFLDGKTLIQSAEWDISNYETSVPLEYKNRLA